MLINFLFSNSSGSFWDPQSSQTLVLGTPSSPVTKMVPVGGKLWCGSQNRVLIINTTTLVQEVKRENGRRKEGGWLMHDDTGREMRLTPPSAHHDSSRFSAAALVPGGHGQQPLRHVHGGVRSGRVAGVARQRARPAVPRSELREPDGGGRGARRAQDARR